MNNSNSQQQTGYFIQNFDDKSSLQDDTKRYSFIKKDNYTFNDDNVEDITPEDESKFYKKAFETKLH